MSCPRCSGLLVPETVHDGGLSEELLRCVNCGRMAKEGEMPKFIDEAHRERWMEGQRIAREVKKKQAQASASAPPCTSVVKAIKPAKPAAKVIDTVAVTKPSLELAIDRLREGLDVLVEAKSILERHQA